MSNVKPPEGTESASLQSTRQMLDDLDALMDRMLALPVNDLEDAPPAAHEIVRMPTVLATLTVLEPSGAEDEVQPDPPAPRAKFPSYTTDLAPAPPEAFTPPPPRPSAAPEPFPEEVIPPSIMSLSVPNLRSVAPRAFVSVRRRSLASRCLLPLLWANQGFDKLTMLFGSPGRWLRGARGRHFLAMTGLALLGVAGLWLVKDWLGWTW